MTGGKSASKTPVNRAFALSLGIVSLFVLITFFGCLSNRLPASEALPGPPAGRSPERDSVPAPPPPSSRQCIWQNVDKVIAIGDLHGDYEHFVAILQDDDIKLVDEGLHWIGGKTHLVQIGDIMDRGEHAKDIFDLIKKLEKEAVQSGGMVHMLIGNHEEINITEQAFDFQDTVTVSQFKDFLRDDYKKQKEAEFQKKVGPGGNTDGEWKKLMDDPEAQAEYFEHFNTYYGRWIAEEHNAVIKINDTVFVHGGINEKYSKMKLQDINNRYYAEFLRAFRGERFRPTILWDQEGPLWFRELATWGDPFRPEVDKILANLGANHMVVAHTPVVVDSMKRFSGKIYIIDTGISSVYMHSNPRGFLSALIIENGKFEPWNKNYAP